MPWPVHPTGFFGARGDQDTYRIERSLRFNSADSANLTRTPSSAGNRKTFTISFWAKRSSLSSNFHFIQAGPDTNTITSFSIGENGGSPDNINLTFFDFQSGSYTTRLISTQVFRDPSAWIHFVASIDTTQSTASSRVRLYANGSQITSFSTSTYPSQNQDLVCNNNVAHRIGSYVTTRYSDGYITEYNLIVGQALTPSSFGETDAITGRWKAKAYSGTYGTNGFYLKFADNSGTTSTTLGKDSSGNGNNWTPNNFQVSGTPASVIDSLVDSPTNYGTDTGVGGEVRGNYATWNALVLNNKTGETSQVFSNANLEVRAFGDNSGSPYTHTQASIAVSTGKYYFEVTHNGSGGIGDGNDNEATIGIVNLNSSPNVGRGDGVAGSIYSGNGAGYYRGGDVFALGSTVNSHGNTYGSGDIIGVAVDLQNFRVWFSKNGVWQGAGSPNPATNTSPNVSGLPTNGLYAPAVSNYVGSSTRRTDFIANFGQRPFAYTAPAGFKALCTTNLTQPTIQKPSKYMDVVAYTGTGASNSISSLGFSPDLVWIKNRGGATSHAIYDTTRGTQAQLSSDTTGDEVTSSTGLTAFGSNGFTIGTSSLVNTSGTQYVAWSWDEAPIAGMDIVSYTGNGANRTIAHGLGVAPKMMIVKARVTASTDQGWPVYHTGVASDAETDYLLLNSTAAAADLNTVWNDTAPTSSVFSVGTNALVNTNNDTYIAYLFAEVEGFSKFGSYTGNGSADGPFVWCGFRPSVVIAKSTGGTGNWTILDYQREGYNVDNDPLFPNLSNAEGTTDLADFLSNGFKIRTTDASFNTSGSGYIFSAWSESPFKYARAR